MAQLFDDFTSYALGAGDLPPWIKVLGDATVEIETDTGVMAEQVLRYQSGGSTAALLVDSLPATAGAQKILCRVRHGTATSGFLLRPRHVGTDSADGILYERQNEASAFRQRNTALSTIQSGPELGLTVTDFYFLRVEYDPDNTLRAKWWTGALADEPTDFQAVTTSGTIDTASTAKVSFGTFGGAFVRLDWVGIGTDGDPAPTGPLVSLTPPTNLTPSRNGSIIWTADKP